MLGSTGCYYSHLAVGQAKLLWARQPIEELLEDPEIDPELRDNLELVNAARAFAGELGLDIGDQYTSFVFWPEDRIITSIIATRPFEIEAAGFRFPIIGTVPYKGFFDIERAEREAEKLRASGMDICMGGVSAYSTLGWFDDPLTSPMLNASRDAIVETVVHELVHATVFLRSQPDFNEGVANFIGEEAAILFFASGSRAPVPTTPPRNRIEDGRIVAETLMTVRQEVADLYDQPIADNDRTARRNQLDVRARETLANLALTSRDPQRLAKFARLNDACLAIQSTYVADTPLYLDLLERLDGDLVRFIDRLRNTADSEDPRATFFAP